MLSILKQRKEPQPATRDRVIIFDQDKRNVEILAVSEANEERVLAGNKTIPTADLQLNLSKQGRVWVLNAPTAYIEATENLARIERSTIIRQLAQYNKPREEIKGINWMNIALIAGLVIVAIVAAAGGK